MLAKIVFSLLFATLAICDPKGHRWHQTRPKDRRSNFSQTLVHNEQLTISSGRSPCPGINALANHGYLPHNGLNVSLERFITGFRKGLNFDEKFVRDAVAVYQPFTTTGNNNTLNLNDLDHHSIPGEHDGSLSRDDLCFGDNHSFNQTIWNSVAAHFQNDTISIPDAARARKDRFAAARAINKEFTPSNISSFGETGLYLKAMRGQDKATKTKYVQILFREWRFLLGVLLCILHSDMDHRRGTNSFQGGIQEIQCLDQQ
ncbi:MAG: hypothetical protein Q9226_005158 [Calogaya cf. arnoldii]